MVLLGSVLCLVDGPGLVPGAAKTSRSPCGRELGRGRAGFRASASGGDKVRGCGSGADRCALGGKPAGPLVGPVALSRRLQDAAQRFCRPCWT